MLGGSFRLQEKRQPEHGGRVTQTTNKQSLLEQGKLEIMYLGGHLGPTLYSWPLTSGKKQTGHAKYTEEASH